MPVPAPPPARKPVSMLWVLAAIGCFVVIHTVVNLAFRKPERPHEPAAEARERERKFVKAERNGWTRYAARLSTPASTEITSADAATITRSPAPDNILHAVSFDLAGRPERDPILHPGPTFLATSTVLPADAALRLVMHFDASKRNNAFGLVLAYSKENQLHLFLQDEDRTAPDESPVAPAPVLELTLPPHVLSAGEWQATLYTKDVIFKWGFTVPANLAPPPAAVSTP